MVDDITDIGDRSVYRTRSMWRCDNTWNEKGSRFKNRVNPSLSLDSMMIQARNKHDGTVHGWGMRDADISAYIPRLPKFEDKVKGSYASDFYEDFRPCMRKLWEMDAPPEGQRHQFLHIMARHCFRSGLSRHEAEQLFANHHFWSTVNERDYIKVITSVYRTGKDQIGCKKGRDAEVLRPHCSLICALNDELDVFKLLGGKDERVS
jgi:hypothetical protein